MLGFTQRELAQCVGIDTISVWRHERGEMVPNALTLQRYASELGIDGDQFTAVLSSAAKALPSASEQSVSHGPDTIPVVLFEMLSDGRYGAISADEKTYLMQCVQTWPDIEPGRLGAMLLLKRLVETEGVDQALAHLSRPLTTRGVIFALGECARTAENIQGGL